MEHAMTQILRHALYVNENTWLNLSGGPAVVKRRVVEADGKISLTVQHSDGTETVLTLTADESLSICEWPDSLTYAVALAMADHCPNVGRHEADSQFMRAVASEDFRCERPADFVIRDL